MVGLVEPLINDLGLELVEIRLKQVNERQVLDIAIDKDGGVGIDDCARASRKISLVLDVEAFIPFKYTLEVGSPGIFRELKTPADFVRFNNSRVKATYTTADSTKKKVIGVLIRFENEILTIQEGPKNYQIGLNQLKKIHLFPDF